MLHATSQEFAATNKTKQKVKIKYSTRGEKKRTRTKLMKKTKKTRKLIE